MLLCDKLCDLLNLTQMGRFVALVGVVAMVTMYCLVGHVGLVAMETGSEAIRNALWDNKGKAAD